MNSPFPADGRLVPFGARAPLSMGGNPGKDARGRATGRVKNLCPWAGDAGWRRDFAVLQGKKPGILYVLQDFVQGRAAKGLAGRPSTPDKYRFQTPPENPGRRFLPPPPSGHLFCLEMPERLLYNRWDSGSCLKIGEMPNGERFFRQSRRFDAGILCVWQGKSTQNDEKRSAAWAF